MAKSKQLPIENKTAVEAVKPYVTDFYTDVRTLMRHPITMDFKRKMATECVRYFQNNPEVITWNAYMNALGMLKMTWYRLEKDCPEMQEAREYARQVMAERRENGAMEGRYSVPYSMFMQPHYDEDFKAMTEWRARLKGETEGKGSGTITVVMEGITKPELQEKPKAIK